MSRNRVLIVDDHPVFRQGIKDVIETESNIDVVGQAADGEVAIELAYDLMPDVILMDVNLPTINGLQVTRRIKSAMPETKIVVLTGYDDVEQAIAQSNSLPYAFQASVLTQNLDFGLHCSRHLDAATVMINDHTAFRVDWMPFAGIRQSGLGVGGIPYTFEDMQIDKQIVIRSKQL